jgi:hypothetical protein
MGGLPRGLSSALRSRIECREDRIDGRVVSRIAAHVAIRHLSTRPNDEDRAELPDVSPHTGRPKTRAQRAQRLEGQGRGEHLDSAAAKTRGAIGAQLRIHQQWAVEFEIVAKSGCEIRGAIADDDEFDSARSNFFDPVAQLRDLLAAEESTEVADEDEDDRLLLPERTQGLGFARRVGKLDLRQPVRISHRVTLSATNRKDDQLWRR